jgi:hypothetical protein
MAMSLMGAFLMRLERRRMSLEAWNQACRDMSICPQCLDRGIIKHHRRADFHEGHARQKIDLGICITVVFLLSLLLGVSWLTQWKRTVWLFLPTASETP